jgi:hypothetical protein
MPDDQLEAENNDTHLNGVAGQGDGQKPSNDKAPSQNGDVSNRIEDLPQWAQDLIRETRDEAAQRRIALKTEQEAARKRDQARLAEEGKYKELAETRAQELANLQPFQERAETLEKMIRTSNEARIEKVREDMRGLVPTDYAPEKLSGWLDANWERLLAQPAPNIDAGAGGGSGQRVQLDSSEQELAKKMGMSPEEYTKFKARSS